MRVVIAPDKFAGTLSALQAAEAIAQGWRSTCANDSLDLVPLSDGGPGFVSVLATAHPSARLVECEVTGPLGAPVAAQVLIVDGTIAYIESAMANGLHLVDRPSRDPRVTTTAGVGELIRAAVNEGATKLVIGLGGSATNDGGAGMLQSMGVDTSAETIDLEPARNFLGAVELCVATDVDNPLLGSRGATRGFAPQKFTDPDRVLDVELVEMEEVLAGLAQRVGRRPDGKDAAVALGSGAAGGLGFGLIALGATRVPGISTVLDAVRLADRIGECDLVVTGEGCFDWQSLRGKTVSGVAELALANARPAVVLAGRVEVGRREYGAIGIAAAFSTVENCGSVELAMNEPAQTLRNLAARVAGTWGGS